MFLLRFRLATVFATISILCAGAALVAHYRAERDRRTRAIRLLSESPYLTGADGNPAALVRSVNFLRTLGKKGALRAIRAYSDKLGEDADGTIVLVLPLLFEGKKAAPTPFHEFIHLEGDLPFLVQVVLPWGGQSSKVDVYPSGGPVESLREQQANAKKALLEWADDDSTVLRKSPLRPVRNPVILVDSLIEQHREDHYPLTVCLRLQAYKALSEADPSVYDNWSQSGSAEDWRAFVAKQHTREIGWSDSRQQFTVVPSAPRAGPTKRK